MNQFNKKIVLEDGREFYGYGFGADKEAVNELVFNTSMVGYQEVIFDQCYSNQMVCMTYPLIGNYGITDEEYEKKNPSLGGVIVREYNDSPSNFSYTKTLNELLEEYGIPAISGVDTRMITKIIREEGIQKVLITNAETSVEEAVAKIKAYEMPTDAVAQVSCKKRWYSRTPNHKYDVVVIDCGLKYDLIRNLNKKGCNLIVVPYDTDVKTILSLRPNGVVISNGPGNPQDVQAVIDTVKELSGQLPIFGDGLGHQIIALAYGAKVSKLKFGHHGSNHPVKDVETGKIDMASQNHVYAVDEASLAGTGLRVTHVNVLDGTVEGIKHESDKTFSVQFYPGSDELFDKFIDTMKEEFKNA